MNKKIKTVLIVALSLFGAGIVICLCISLIIGFDYSRLHVDLNPDSSEASDAATEHFDKPFDSSVDSVTINVSFADVIVTLSQDEDIHLSYDNTEVTYFDLKNDKSSINLQQHQRSHIELFGFQSDCTVKLSVPSGFKGSLELNSASGDIELNDITANDGIELNSVSGSIKAIGCASDELEAGTTSGDIELSAAVTSDIEASSVSGRISVLDIENETSLDLSSASGDLKLQSVNARELNGETISGSIELDSLKGTKAKLHTTSGDVRLNSADYTELLFDSISGTISGSVVGSADDYSVFVETVSGTNSLSGHRGRGERTLDLSSTSGDFKINFEGSSGKAVAKVKK